jgi:glycosyltransferase 2 family protein
VVLASALPVSINGLGITESAFVLLYAQVGLAPEVALAAAVLRRLVVVSMSLVGAVLWLLHHPVTPSQD